MNIRLKHIDLQTWVICFTLCKFGK